MGQGAGIAPREQNRGEAEQEGEPTGFGATGIASCLRPRGYHEHGHDLETRNMDWRHPIHKKEIAAPKGGDCVILSFPELRLSQVKVWMTIYRFLPSEVPFREVAAHRGGLGHHLYRGAAAP